MAGRMAQPLAALARGGRGAVGARAAVMGERRALLRNIIDPYDHFVAQGDAGGGAEDDADGPFAGITACVADVIDVRGLPTQLGLTGKHKNDDHFPFCTRPAQRDAPITAWWRAHGGRVNGKTIVAPFGFNKEPLARPLANPWSLEYGSGSGAATAVGLGLADVGLAMQTASELTVHAARNGVVGYKSTYGTFPGTHSFAPNPNDRGYGFFTRSVADARYLVRHIDDDVDTQYVATEAMQERLAAASHGDANIATTGLPPKLVPYTDPSRMGTSSALIGMQHWRPDEFPNTSLPWAVLDEVSGVQAHLTADGGSVNGTQPTVADGAGVAEALADDAAEDVDDVDENALAYDLDPDATDVVIDDLIAAREAAADGDVDLDETTPAATAASSGDNPQEGADGPRGAAAALTATPTPEATGGSAVATTKTPSPPTPTAQPAPRKLKISVTKKKKKRKGKKDDNAPAGAGMPGGAGVPAVASTAGSSVSPYAHSRWGVDEATWARKKPRGSVNVKDDQDPTTLALIGGRGGDWVYDAAATEAGVDKDLDAPDRIIRVGAVRVWGRYSSTAQWEIESAVDALLGSERFRVVDVNHHALISDVLAMTESAALAADMALPHSIRYWLHEFDGVLRHRQWPDAVGKVVRGGRSNPYATQVPHDQLRWTRLMQVLFDSARLDVMMTPVAPGLAARSAGISAQHEFGTAFTVSGNPTVTLPLGRVCPQSRVPLGVQLIGRRNDDRRLLAVAERVEAVLAEAADKNYTPLWDMEPMDIIMRGGGRA